ncbi:MAG: PAS domain S-box-containing protein [Cellvibrionaceae bacterium]|jgi:PAS domain S-box-containing protein
MKFRDFKNEKSFFGTKLVSSLQKNKCEWLSMNDRLEQTLFAASPLAQVIVDPFQDRILLANKSAQSLLWSKTSNLLTQRFSIFFAGIFPELITFTQEIFDKNSARRPELILRSPDGSEQRKVEATGFRIKYDTTDNQLAIVFYFSDKTGIERNRHAEETHKHYLSGISQWRRIEKVFQEIERNNQLILTAVGEGIYGVDDQGKTTFVNPKAEELLGWRAEDLVGKDIHAMIHHSHPSGEAYQREECPIYAAFCDGVVHRVVDEVFWRKDGKIFPVEYTSTPIKDNGHLVGAVVIFRDLTEQKLSQQKLLKALREIESLKHRLEQENAYLQEEIKVTFNHQTIVGKSQAIQHIVQQIDLVGPTDATVLITGESGTGKELIARAIHQASRRSQRPLIRVNCAAIPRDLFESEFFGHVKGAFTGATNNRIGRFELADGGTIFLDEVGEIPLELQGKLLRVLQEQQFERVGDAQTKNIDVRVIAATNKNLKRLAADKIFREDLYFRLNVFPIESVPLRDRREDIPLLAVHLLDKAQKKFNKGKLRVPKSQINELINYSWPGNIRELENIIERQVIVAKGNTLIFDRFPTDSQPQSIILDNDLEIHVATEAERKQQVKGDIVKALRITEGKVYGQNGAAEYMGLKPTTLASRIKKYNIDPRAFKT